MTKTIQSKQFKAATISYLVFALLSYLYMMVNDIHNYDTLVSMPEGDGAGLNVGRWMVYLLYWGKRKLLGTPWYNVGFINVLIALLLVWIAVILLLSILEIDEVSVAMSIAAITVANPCMVVAMVFHFVAIAYGISFLLAVLGVWLVKKEKLTHFVLGAACVGTGIAGYQAHFTVAAMLFALLVIQLLVAKEKVGKVLASAAKYFAALICAYIFYMGVLRLLLWKTNTTLSGYQGADSMGKLDIDTLVTVIPKTYRNVFSLMHGNYVSLTGARILNVCYGCVFLIVAIGILLELINNQKANWLHSLLLIFVMAIMPMVLDSIEIIAPKAHVYSLMGIALIGICYLPYTMFRQGCIAQLMTRVSVVVVLLMSLTYVYITNVNMTAMHYNLEVAKQWNAALYEKAIQTEGYTANSRICLIGDSFDNAPEDTFDIGELRYKGTEISVNVYSKESLMRLYFGQRYSDVSQTDREKYADMIAEMGVFPDNDSVQVVDGKAFVKISNE